MHDGLLAGGVSKKEATNRNEADHDRHDRGEQRPGDGRGQEGDVVLHHLVDEQVEAAMPMQEAGYKLHGRLPAPARSAPPFPCRRPPVIPRTQMSCTSFERAAAASARSCAVTCPCNSWRSRMRRKRPGAETIQPRSTPSATAAMSASTMGTDGTLNTRK